MNHQPYGPEAVVHCPRCRQKMREQPRTYHKQRKWICPHCGKVRMQKPKPEKE